MANQYATVPALIVGNVTITGNLTVGGDTILLGSSARKTRIQNSVSQAFLTHNWDRLAITQDAGGNPSASLDCFDVTPASAFENAAAGAPGAPTTAFYSDAGSSRVGADVLRIGAALPFGRLFKNAAPDFALSYNLDTDLATRDDGATAALVLKTLRPEMVWRSRYLNAAGAINDAALGHNFSQDGTSTNVTGTTAETTVFSKIIRANSLGTHGGFIVDVMFNGVAQGGVATLLRLKFGPTTLVSVGRAIVDDVHFRVLVMNNGATNVQRGWQSNYGVATLLVEASILGAADTTLDQTLSVTIQPGAVGDSWTKRVVEVHSFGGSAAAF